LVHGKAEDYGNGYLDLAPTNWTATRTELNPEELDAALCRFTTPPA